VQVRGELLTGCVDSFHGGKVFVDIPTHNLLIVVPGTHVTRVLSRAANAEILSAVRRIDERPHWCAGAIDLLAELLIKPYRQVCEVWKRVMWHHRPVSELNNGKKQERADHVAFRETNEGESK
jgi:hypothetical protein